MSVLCGSRQQENEFMKRKKSVPIFGGIGTAIGTVRQAEVLHLKMQREEGLREIMLFFVINFGISNEY